MKRKILTAFLALALMVCAVPISASAAADSASTEISYQIDYGYTVNIPASVNMSKGASLEITASDVFLSGDAVVNVSVDVITSKFGDDNITLNNSEGFGCDFSIYREDVNGENRTKVTCEDSLLASFCTGDTQARSGGKITIAPILAEGVVPGTYSGTIHFLIEEVYVEG